jgi:hypothetical protein
MGLESREELDRADPWCVGVEHEPDLRLLTRGQDLGFGDPGPPFAVRGDVEDDRHAALRRRPDRDLVCAADLHGGHPTPPSGIDHLADFGGGGPGCGVGTSAAVSTDATTATAPAVRDLLLRLAGPRAFVRGEAYLSEGRVRSLHEDGNVLAGVVEGSEPYRVEVHRGVRGRSELIAACTCPHGADGRFCKHAVAVALAGLEERESREDEDGMRGWLERQRHGLLVDLLAEAAAEDPSLAARLAARREQDAAGPPPPREATERGRRSVRRW